MKKKIKDFMLSLVVPHRMVKFKDMSIFISLILLLLGCVISVFSSNARMTKFVEKRIYGEYKEIKEDNNDGIGEVNFTINNDNLATYDKQIIEKELPSEDGKKTYKVTLVFGEIIKKEEKKDELIMDIQLENFNVDDYVFYNQAHRVENTIYLLYIFTDGSIYHLYDLGQGIDNGKYVDNVSSIYYFKDATKDANAGFFDNLFGTNVVTNKKYYLPKDETELLGSSYVTDTQTNEYYNYSVSKWSVEAKEGEQKTIAVNGNDVVVNAMPKLGQSIEDTNYYGIDCIIKNVIKYSDMKSYANYDGEFKLDCFKTSLSAFITGHFDSYVFRQTDTNKGFLLLISLCIFILIPVVFSLFVWLFTRKRGMTSYKGYLNIMSIIQFYLAILFFIIGWFVNILNNSIIIVIGLLIMLWYYIFVIYQITKRIEKENDEFKDSDGSSNNKEESKTPTKPEFKKIDKDVSVIG